MATCKTCSMDGMVYGRLDVFGIVKWKTLTIARPEDITVWSIVSTAGCAEISGNAWMQGAEILAEVTMNR
jgi:hypothetical protein